MEIYVGVLTAVFALGTVVEQDTEKTKVLGKCFCISILLMSGLKFIS